MKSFTIATILLPTLSFAFPQLANVKRFTNDTTTPPPPTSGAICTPAKYQCRQNADKSWGWDVCSTSSQWVNAGTCGASETCIFNPLNGSPYCVPTPASLNPSPPAGSGTPQQQCYPGKYQCKFDASRALWSIETCGAAGAWDHTLDCAASETCTYGAVAGYPYCTPKTDGCVCAPGTYQCSYVQSWGWDVCSTEGRWVRGGSCKGGETCSFNPINGSPYCI